LNKDILASGILILLIEVCITPNINGEIKTINEGVFEDVTYDRIEDIYSYKYDDRGHFFKNPLGILNRFLILQMVIYVIIKIVLLLHGLLAMLVKWLNTIELNIDKKYYHIITRN
jgi:hypothetical protein